MELDHSLSSLPFNQKPTAFYRFGSWMAKYKQVMDFIAENRLQCTVRSYTDNWSQMEHEFCAEIIFESKEDLTFFLLGDVPKPEKLMNFE